MKQCSICHKTEQDTRIIKRDGILYCRKHYLQLYRHGKILSRTIYDENTVRIEGGTAYIGLFDVKGIRKAEIIIDAEDLSKIQPLKWHRKKSHGTVYAIAHIGNKKCLLHRLILDYQGTKDIDHINGNGLDNRKANLRIISHGANVRNQVHKPFCGVRHVPSGRWQAHIMKDGQDIYLGTYDTREEAQSVRQQKEKELGTN